MLTTFLSNREVNIISNSLNQLLGWDNLILIIQVYKLGWLIVKLFVINS